MLSFLFHEAHHPRLPASPTSPPLALSTCSRDPPHPGTRPSTQAHSACSLCKRCPHPVQLVYCRFISLRPQLHDIQFLLSVGQWPHVCRVLSEVTKPSVSPFFLRRGWREGDEPWPRSLRVTLALGGHLGAPSLALAHRGRRGELPLLPAGQAGNPGPPHGAIWGGDTCRRQRLGGPEESSWL